MPGLRIEIDASEVALLAKAWEAAPEMVRGELAAAMTEATAFLQRETQGRTPVAMGTLRASIQAREPQILSDQVIGVVGSPLDYAEPVELGTRPHFPPIQPLQDWVQQKLGIGDEKESRQVAFAVARKIARVGTKGAFMFSGAFRASEPQVQRIFAAANERIAERLGREA